MLENLRLHPRYDGFVFLSESARGAAWLATHHHVELEMNLVLRGSLTYVTDGHRYTFSRGELLWLFPAQQHRVVDRSPDAQYYVAVFKPSMIRQSCHGSNYAGLRRKRVQGGGMLHTLLPPADFDLLRRMIDILIADGPDPDVLNREAGFGLSRGFRFAHRDPDGLNAGLRHLLLLCWRYQVAGSRSGRAILLHPAVLKALDLLRADPEVGNLTELAARCGVSKAYLSRMFARQVGAQLSRFRNSSRLERFWESYRKPPQKTLTEAAFAAGFGSYAQFYKIFREAYGRGPRERSRPALGR
jgi:methylphosphotriester-DNA--protein-cysteine methyltransferase